MAKRLDPNEEIRYVTEILDQHSGSQLVNEPYCELLMMHIKLFKSKSQLTDIESALDEAEAIRHELYLAG